MPTVPIDEVTQQLRPLDVTPLQAANFAAGSEQVGQAAAALGQTGEQYAEADFQRGQIVAASAAKQADVQVNQANTSVLYGDDNTPGYTALRGGNALLARKDAETSLQRNARDALSAIDDPLTKTLAAKAIQARLADGMATVAKHYNEQQLEYGREQTAGRISDLTDQAVRNSTDPDQFGAYLGALKTEVHSQAQQEGWPIAKELQQVVAATDGVYRGVVERLGLTDAMGAQHYLDLHRDVISEATQQILDTQLHAHVEDQQARQAGDGAAGIGPAPQIGPTVTSPNRDALFKATVQVESAGRTGLRSPAGALGTAQVMPATAKAVCAKLGIAYDEDRLQHDPEYCNRIGRAYQDGLLAHYGGNATLATAAYNAGPGNVDKWIAMNGDPRKGEISDAAWAARIPFKETRHYIPLVFNAMARQTGTPVSAITSPAPTINLEGGIAAIRARDDLSPAAQDKAIGYLRQRFADHQAAIAQVQKQAYESVLPGLQNGTIKSIADVDPVTWSNMSPEQNGTVIAALEHNAKGVDPGPDPKLLLQAYEAASVDPVGFAHTDLTPLLGKLPKADIEKLGSIQKMTLRAGGAPTPQLVAYKHIAEATKDIMVAAGLTYSTAPSVRAPDSPTSTPMAQRIVDFHNGVAADVEVYHTTNGKYPTDDVIRSMAMRRATQVTLPGTGGWFSSDHTALLGEVAPGTKVSLSGAAVPAAARAAIIAASQRAGRGTPNDATIANIYIHARP